MTDSETQQILYYCMLTRLKNFRFIPLMNLGN
jgi:hypothetical protein